MRFEVFVFLMLFLIAVFGSLIIRFKLFQKIKQLSYKKIGVILILIGCGLPSITYCFTINGDLRIVNDRFAYEAVFAELMQSAKNNLSNQRIQSIAEIALKQSELYDNAAWYQKINMWIPYKYIVMFGIILVLTGVGTITLITPVKMVKDNP